MLSASNVFRSSFLYLGKKGFRTPFRQVSGWMTLGSQLYYQYDDTLHKVYFDPIGVRSLQAGSERKKEYEYDDLR